MTPKERAIRTLQNALGDDLERAERAFVAYAEKQMDEPYGQSDYTPRQILAQYREARAENLAALEWAKRQTD